MGIRQAAGHPRILRIARYFTGSSSCANGLRRRTFSMIAFFDPWSVALAKRARSFFNLLRRERRRAISRSRSTRPMFRHSSVICVQPAHSARSPGRSDKVLFLASGREGVNLDDDSSKKPTSGGCEPRESGRKLHPSRWAHAGAH